MSEAPKSEGGELESWKTPASKDVKPAPELGSKAPSSSQLKFPNGKPTVVVFLRHCGCPFAEKSFKELADLSYQREDIQCVAVSHSSKEATDRWIPEVGGAWSTKVIVDEERDLYALWGLGISNVWHALGPSVLWSLYKLGSSEGIWNRTTESGTRWQTSGAFAVDTFGKVCWAHISGSADDLPDLNEAAKALSGT